jgi:pimeloyl-ACP methyl ester carboxylesterase
VEIQLGRFAAEVERPEPVKFAWPVVLLPELFTGKRHLAVVLGYLATIGWEAYAIDLHAAAGAGARPARARVGFSDLVARAGEVLDALGRDAIVLGHGLGGLVAMKLAERADVKAAVAYAPALPGLRSPLVGGLANRVALWRGASARPPGGRALFEFIADAEPYQRESIIRALAPDAAAAAALEVARGAFEAGAAAASAAPRLIVTGDSDLFAPVDRARAFAESLGAKLSVIPGRGHWLIGGRALERAIGETQRFLVRALGQDLLLLYKERNPEGGDAGDDEPGDD